MQPFPHGVGLSAVSADHEGFIDKLNSALWFLPLNQHVSNVRARENAGDWPISRRAITKVDRFT